VQPAKRTSTRPQRAKRTPDAHSLHATYIKLTPISDEDLQDMNIDQVDEIKIPRVRATDTMKVPTIVCSQASDLRTVIHRYTVLHVLS
jgi:hypothetical protein